MRIIWQTKLNPITQILYIVIYWFGFSILNIFQQIHSLKTKIKKLSPNSWGKSCSSCTSLRYNYLIALAANEIVSFRSLDLGDCLQLATAAVSGIPFTLHPWSSPSWNLLFLHCCRLALVRCCRCSFLVAVFGLPCCCRIGGFCCRIQQIDLLLILLGAALLMFVVDSRLNCWLKALFAFRRFSLLWSYCLLFWFSRQGFNYVL